MKKHKETYCQESVRYECISVLVVGMQFAPTFLKGQLVLYLKNFLIIYSLVQQTLEEYLPKW